MIDISKRTKIIKTLRRCEKGINCIQKENNIHKIKKYLQVIEVLIKDSIIDVNENTNILEGILFTEVK